MPCMVTHVVQQGSSWPQVHVSACHWHQILTLESVLSGGEPPSEQTPTSAPTSFQRKPQQTTLCKLDHNEDVRHWCAHTVVHIHTSSRHALVLIYSHTSTLYIAVLIKNKSRECWLLKGMRDFKIAANEG